VKNEWLYLAVLDPEQENDVTFLGTNEEKIAEPLMYEI
jgi:hypothetical protein